MYKYQDPLHKIYTKLINESNFVDHTSYERGKDGRATNLTREPGLHVHEIEEIKLNDGSIVPVDVNFSAEWNNEDYEQVEGRGRYKTQDAGFYTNIHKFTIPAWVKPEELDEWTGKPGVYKPGMDVTKLIPAPEVQHAQEYLDGLFNDRDHWGQHNHYQSDPRDIY